MIPNAYRTVRSGSLDFSCTPGGGEGDITILWEFDGTACDSATGRYRIAYALEMKQWCGVNHHSLLDLIEELRRYLLLEPISEILEAVPEAPPSDAPPSDPPPPEPEPA